MPNELLSRKFIGFIVTLAMLFALVLVDKISGSDFVSFATLNLGIYCGANVLTSVVDKSAPTTTDTAV